MIIGTLNSKSVGKTTMAVHLAAWLKLYEYEVAVVDADWSQQCSEWLKEVCPDIPTYVIQNPHELVETVPKMREHFDGIIVDGPAGLDETAGAVLKVSDVVMVPCGPNSPEIKALKTVAEVLKDIQEYRHNKEGTLLPFAFIVPVRTNSRWNSTKVLLDEASKLGFRALPAYVPFRQIYANLSGLPGKPANLLWQLGRSKQVKDAVMDLDRLFQKMFPEVAENDPELLARMMNEPIKRKQGKRKQRVIAERDEQERRVANA